MASPIFHRRLAKLDLHGIIGMTHDFGNLGFPPGSDLTIESFAHVETSADHLPPPALIAYAMVPEILASKGPKGGHRVTYEASHGVCIEPEEEWNEQMMSVPESLERLLSYPGVGSRVHQQHTQKHDVASDSTRLSIMNLYCRDWPELSSFHIEKVDIVGADVYDGEKKHGVCTLTVKPL